MRHFYGRISLDPSDFDALEWQPVEQYQTRPMERRGRPQPVMLRAGDEWVFGS